VAAVLWTVWIMVAPVIGAASFFIVARPRLPMAQCS
jgi:hypothetical protein